MLKQISAQASDTATIDQATDHTAQNKIQRSEFQLDVTEDAPTGDQLRSILEYVGPKKAREVVNGAKDEADALRRLKEDPSKFRAPVVSLAHFPFEENFANIINRLWTGVMVGLVSTRAVLDKYSCLQDMQSLEIMNPRS